MPSRPSRSPNLNGAKQATMTMMKKMAPFVITGLAAVAEHHFLKHDDKRDNASNDDRRTSASEQDKDDNSSVERLKQDVRDLKRSLKRNTKKAVEVALESSSLSNDESSLEAVIGSERVERRRDGKRDVREASRRSDREISGGSRQRDIPEIRVFPPPPPRVPSPPFEIPAYIPIYEPPIYEPPPVQDQPRVPDHTSRRHRRNKHRDTSLIPCLPKDDDDLHATKVATVAGIMEGLYVADIKGDWLGSKGMRVGTAMAAAAGTSYALGRRGDDDWPREMVVDVGVGLLATRLMYGSKRQLENESRK